MAFGLQNVWGYVCLRICLAFSIQYTYTSNHISMVLAWCNWRQHDAHCWWLARYNAAQTFNSTWAVDVVRSVDYITNIKAIARTMSGDQVSKTRSLDELHWTQHWSFWYAKSRMWEPGLSTLTWNVCIRQLRYDMHQSKARSETPRRLASTRERVALWWPTVSKAVRSNRKRYVAYELGHPSDVEWPSTLIHFIV